MLWLCIKNEIEKVDINSRIDYEFSKFLVKDENKNFRHVGIVTTNLKNSLNFYTNYLGLEIIKTAKENPN